MLKVLPPRKGLERSGGREGDILKQVGQQEGSRGLSLFHKGRRGLGNIFLGPMYLDLQAPWEH